MPSIHPPGARKNNRRWIVRGRIDGRSYEITTDARTKSEAAREWELFVADTRADNAEGDPPAPTGEWTFRDALTHYKATEPRSAEQIGFIERMTLRHIDVIVDGAETTLPLFRTPLSAIRPGAVKKLVLKAYPRAAAATRNRQGIGPLRAVINCAAADDRCAYIRIKPFPETRRAPRRPAANVERLLLKNCDGYRLLYLTMIFRQGWRISETLGVDWDHGVDLQRREFTLYVGKARTEKIVPMHDDVFELLSGVDPADRTGALFPWTVRSSVDSWLKELTDGLGVRFSSHMARHEWASARNEDGFTDADMASAGSWTDVRSLKIYTDVNRDHARSVVQRTRRKK